MYFVAEFFPLFRFFLLWHWEEISNHWVFFRECRNINSTHLSSSFETDRHRPVLTQPHVGQTHMGMWHDFQHAKCSFCSCHPGFTLCSELWACQWSRHLQNRILEHMDTNRWAESDTSPWQQPSCWLSTGPTIVSWLLNETLDLIKIIKKYQRQQNTNVI